MARNRLRGDAKAVAMVRSFTVTAAGSAGDAISVTMNGKTVSTVAPAAPTTSTVAAAIQAALQAAADNASPPEFAEAVWSVNTATVTATAATAGVPFFDFTVAVGGGITISGPTTTTASAGPNHWDTASNWSLGAVPVNTNDVDLIGSNVSLLYGLDQNAVTLASLNCDSTYTGRIGLPAWNPAGYYEFRQKELKIGATLVTIGAGQGSGSSLIKIDNAAVQTTVLILGTGSPSVTGEPAVWWKGTHASNVVTVSGGRVGIAYDLGEVATVATLGVSQANTPPDVQCGTGLTLTTSNVQGGRLTLQSGHTTCNHDAGEVLVVGPSTCNLTTLNGRGGTFRQDAPGTLGTVSLPGGYLDLSRDPRAKTVTNCTAYSGSTVNDPYKHATFTNGIAAPDGVAGPGDPNGATLNLGQNLTITRS